MQDTHIFAALIKNKNCIDFELGNYFDLFDMTARIALDNNRSAIPEHLAPTLEPLNMNTIGWIIMVNGIENNFSYAAGNANLLQIFMPDLQHTTIRKAARSSIGCINTIPELLLLPIV